MSILSKRIIPFLTRIFLRLHINPKRKVIDVARDEFEVEARDILEEIKKEQK